MKFPWNTVMPVGFKETRIDALPDGLKKFDNTCIHSDKIPQRDGQKDGQTDGEKW